MVLKTLKAFFAGLGVLVSVSWTNSNIGIRANWKCSIKPAFHKQNRFLPKKCSFHWKTKPQTLQFGNTAMAPRRSCSSTASCPQSSLWAKFPDQISASMSHYDQVHCSGSAREGTAAHRREQGLGAPLLWFPWGTVAALPNKHFWVLAKVFDFSAKKFQIRMFGHKKSKFSTEEKPIVWMLLRGNHTLPT